LANVDSALLEEEGTLSCSNAFGFSSPNLLDDFCCGDGLAGVALGVVGAMDEETADGCGQGFASYGAGLLEVGGWRRFEGGGSRRRFPFEILRIARRSSRRGRVLC
jgi:hypothetical protein